ncbi:cytochrome c oxidase subunit I [Dermacoccus nishinomiyaensis]|uniref:aa3-type cytochrome oxidase subunit I n=1 Tax=Dermacoccus TaxID=57495 RepID=UPI00078632BC|nr:MULTISPECIES: cytochrome c oxidase subunit I [Dermacoccus]HCQ18298.1 cytochrome c oxidase subunit I [Dermacoccus sp.]MBO1758028.1 cytochrome c oxidase subunit I [Dermacoccus sp. NHGro5]NHC31924.1 cytochrome c oxidase subunit I [Dermacoccus nishinomiyaensis]QQY23358.1 cytochrome c oxidase subunit I [Dermacoccus nishinomiyaensis]TCJ91428.1 cytochrome c oxidase subunit 1 [Dermacoccus sp. SAI-028]
MATATTPAAGLQQRPEARRPEDFNAGRTIVKWLTTTDHKVIGNLYFITSFIFFLLGGAMALVIRAELWSPGLQIVDNPEQFNQLFTMHGTVMLLMFATPLFSGFANALMPLQIGAPDVAFPRLNMFAYWLYLFGSLIAVAGFLTPQGAASFGWFAYAPLSSTTYSPGLGGNLWVYGLALTGFASIMGAVNFVTTIVCMRAPGMTMFRTSIFTWTVLITSILVLLVFPVLAAALFGLGLDRTMNAHVFDSETAGAMLWQHMFWFFGHPEVYIIALPFFGIISEVLPVFSRKPIFGYKTLVFATIAIGALSVSVWAHHMYATGQVLLPFFAVMTMLIAVPTGVKFFNWIGTMWGGSLTFETPMLWALGFLATFLFGGLTGVILASPALDLHLSDSYFVVAHFHYVVFGTVVFAMFAGYYFWWPKFTGRMLNETIGKIHFWLLFVGFHLTFLVQHVLGVEGMPRRYADYLPEDGFQSLNQVSTVGSFLLGASMLPFLYNVYITWKKAPLVTEDDPWGFGASLEWATSCPPPRHNFNSIPRIRSERPAFDLHHPEVGVFSVLPAQDTVDQLGGKAHTA